MRRTPKRAAPHEPSNPALPDRQHPAAPSRTEQAAAAAVDQACRRLRLPTIRAVLDDALTAANREQLTYQGFLAELLLAECDDRDRRSTLRRVKAAGFPRQKWLGDFDFDASPNINAATIHTLAAADWIRKGEPLCLIGDSGTGKSHLLIALGTAAAEKGYRVRYTLATKLVNELVEAADEKQLAKTINRYGRVDLLCIDELGYLELDKRGAELPFRIQRLSFSKAGLTQAVTPGPNQVDTATGKMFSGEQARQVHRGVRGGRSRSRARCLYRGRTGHRFHRDVQELGRS